MSAPAVAVTTVLRIATRSSAQARTQAGYVGSAITAANPTVQIELVLVDTVGDQRQDVPLHTIGGQGVFVKEVQRAVLDGRADLAVHSAKDLPSAPADGLTIVAFTERRDARDALVGSTLDGLALGATVASGSVRRRAQLAALRPDLRFVELRGNIQTRLSKVPADGAIVMAVAALDILGMRDRVAQVMDVDAMVPAVGQGCVAVECRADANDVIGIVRSIDHTETRRAVEAERAFLAELGTGCSLPIGAHVRDGQITAFLADDTGRALQTTVRLGADWNATAAETARGLQAELRP
ncbi:MAG: hemC [Ilumatobacteraceae bacterium]|nr:hemC [Ilumatobacteraceae bacterium]